MFGDPPPDPAGFADSDFRNGTARFTEPNYSANLAMLKPFHAYAADHGVSAITLAMAWILARGDHLIPIPGTRTAEHLTECAAGAGFAMTPAIMDEIEAILPVGWAHGDRYTEAQWIGPERYC